LIDQWWQRAAPSTVRGTLANTVPVVICSIPRLHKPRFALCLATWMVGFRRVVASQYLGRADGLPRWFMGKYRSSLKSRYYSTVKAIKLGRKEFLRVQTMRLAVVSPFACRWGKSHRRRMIQVENIEHRLHVPNVHLDSMIRDI